MVDRIRQSAFWDAAAKASSILGMLAIVTTAVLWFVSQQSDATITKYDVQTLKTQIATLTASLGAVQSQLDARPSMVQFNDQAAHLHALDGRSDELDRRVRATEVDISDLKARVSNIESASAAQIRGHVR